MNQNRCVCCSALIPEGRQACWDCENGNINILIRNKYNDNFIAKLVDRIEEVFKRKH